MNIKRTVLVFSILFVSFITLFGQTNVIRELNDNIIPISIDSNNFTITEELTSVFNKKRIIGLGEATHGTKEFFVFKHQMIKYLVTNFNYTIFIIEADFVGSQIMNDYILNSNGDAFNGLMKMGVGVWFTEEFLVMIEWMRKYNLTQPIDKKIRFYGCDMRYLQLSIIEIKKYLKTKEKLSDSLEKKLDLLELLTNKRATNCYTKSDKKVIIKIMFDLKQVYKEINDNSDSFKLNRYYLAILSQNIEYRFKKGGYKKSVMRDKFMADNCMWIFNYENQNKTIIWAHNEHIAKKSGQSKRTPMGHHIFNKYSNDYYAFGLGFNEGALRAYNPEKKKYEIYNIPPTQLKNSYDFVFAQCCVNNFIIDLHYVSKEKDVFSYFNKKCYSRSIGAVYYPENVTNRNYRHHKLINSYDAVIFFKKTTAATPIKEK